MKQLPEVDLALGNAADAHEVPGLVAMAATGSEIIYQAAFGQRDLGKAVPMTVDTVFWMASMTKAITATAAMQFVEQERLSLDEPVGSLLPALANPQVLEAFSPEGTPRLRPARRAITLRHLMTHTAGFTYNTWNAAMARYADITGLPPARTGLNKALEAPLVFDPGERWEYSIGIDWLGKAIEVASGKRLDVYLKDHILTPLGMTSTGFKLTPDMRARLVGMHQRGADGSLTPTPFETKQEPEFHAGGGGLYSTAGDYIRFIRMLLNGGALDGNRVLKAETVGLMGQNHIGDLNFAPLRSAIPEVSNDYDPWPDQDRKWGLSFLINTKRTPEGRSPGSLSWAGLANTYYWLDTSRNVGGVLLTQVLPFIDAKVMQLFGVFERGVYQSLGDSQAAA